MTHHTQNQEVQQLCRQLGIKPNSYKGHILELLYAGVVLDDMTALNAIGCWSLSQRIGELIKLGINIEKDWAISQNGKRYKTYKLGGAK